MIGLHGLNADYRFIQDRDGVRGWGQMIGGYMAETAYLDVSTAVGRRKKCTKTRHTVRTLEKPGLKQIIAKCIHVIV